MVGIFCLVSLVSAQEGPDEDFDVVRRLAGLELRVQPVRRGAAAPLHQRRHPRELELLALPKLVVGILPPVGGLKPSVN